MHKPRQNNLTFISISLLTICAIVVGSSVLLTRKTAAQAQQNPAYGQALEIAPPVIYATADPGQTITRQIYLRDVSSGDLIVTGEANDFTAGDEEGTPKILLEDADNPNPYSLKDWIVTPAELRLVPKEVKTMTIKINVPANASPGGHYGIIRFTATPPSLRNSGVSLSTSLGALVLLTVSGPVNEKLSIKDFYVNKDGKKGTVFQSNPLNFVQRLENTGNVHEQPSGLVTIKDMFGRTTATLGINQPPRNILPQSIRKFEQNLDKSVIGNKRLFGRYTAKLAVTYGNDKKTVTSDLTFWVIPYKLIAIVIAALIAGFFALRFGIKRYNKYILSKARGGRRR